ncbi:hypothetical protein QJS04_geneDACA014456 [Acorus gramineus]|uniref:ZC3H15/TMA46 family C-terminal domain-containing protein n=1 Tax=Acorus gramineus TaxID=55184 RepID=A0AAV9BL80_ACOGR|nr:hypothetical protein QJS04_geneDACA014456 [Acorus gramineus]
MGAEEEQQQRMLENEEGGLQESKRPISPAQFLAWKRQKEVDASAKRAEAAQKRAEDLSSGTEEEEEREWGVSGLRRGRGERDWREMEERDPSIVIVEVVVMVKGGRIVDARIKVKYE